jgi:hypothetical protein
MGSARHLRAPGRLVYLLVEVQHRVARSQFVHTMGSGSERTGELRIGE